MSSVKAWRELVTIPTYEAGKPEKSPMFLENRVYQGSSGVVYPYPVIESIANEPTPKEWQAVWIENEYIKVMVLPELGGRIQMAYDKIKGRHFVYYNHVIKPALVGLAGPWISGGIEFNWPQHHRPSTYMAVDSTIVENDDGSVTVWVNEMERMTHQKGMAGFTLRPGCAYLEIQGRVSNRTSLPQTFLWWANPAVEVNDAYQSVFPPDVDAVFDHGKRAVSSFPIATGTYYKMDYSAGVDISNYRNIPVPTSYMAVNSKYDFEGGYENDTHGGMLHVASHHYSPGKKQWTWGNGDFGRAWDRNLTDEYGGRFRPYIELMAGVYTENQPDFTWLMPYEEKQFTQYFMPYRELGVVKQATKDVIVSVGVQEFRSSGVQETDLDEWPEVRIKMMTTSRQRLRVRLEAFQQPDSRSDPQPPILGGSVTIDEEVELGPEDIYDRTVSVPKVNAGLCLYVYDAGSSRLKLKWHPEPDEVRRLPDAAEAALRPEDTKTNDQLYLTGLHLEQYRHATWCALDYYEEALRRDPKDVRCLNQTGLWYLRRGRFDKAVEYLCKAVDVWKKRNPNPYDGEAVFNYALCLKYLGCIDEAYELFWKSTWNKAWADAGYFEAACISASQERWEDALEELDRCLVFNSCNHKAHALKAAVMRKSAGVQEFGSSGVQEPEPAIDHFNYGVIYEKYLQTKDEEVLKEMTEKMHGNVYNYHELALDYAQAGLWQEVIDILQLSPVEHPLTYYYIGYAKDKLGKRDEAIAYFKRAEATDSSYCFPNRLEDVLALELAKRLNPDGARAPYYLGCLYYDKRQYDLAATNWELSARLDPSFPIVWRNLALVSYNKRPTPGPSPREGSIKTAIDQWENKAVEYMERAFHLDESDARMLMELDQLYKRLHRGHQERLDFLQQYGELIAQRDDLVLEEITLLNLLGRYEEAKEKLDTHLFHPWEGGEGKVPAQYQICRVEMAKQEFRSSGVQECRSAGVQECRSSGVQEFGSAGVQEAIRLLEECLVYPPHLGEGKLYGAQENDFYYLLGMAYASLGEKEKAKECWEKGTKGPTEPVAAMYYNDAKPDKIFYAGLCYRALGEEEKALGLFWKLVNYGKQHLFDHVTMDYFAVSLPDLLIWDGDLDEQNRVHCLYMLALGYYGLNDLDHSNRYLAKALKLDSNHQGLCQFRSFVQEFRSSGVQEFGSSSVQTP